MIQVSEAIFSYNHNFKLQFCTMLRPTPARVMGQWNEQTLASSSFRVHELWLFYPQFVSFFIVLVKPFVKNIMYPCIIVPVLVTNLAQRRDAPCIA